MDLKEIVNLRKLREEFYETSFEESGCSECPFRECCRENVEEYCPVEAMLGYVSMESLEMEKNEEEKNFYEDVYEDLYDMERKGTLKENYQVEYKNIKEY